MSVRSGYPAEWRNGQCSPLKQNPSIQNLQTMRLKSCENLQSTLRQLPSKKKLHGFWYSAIRSVSGKEYVSGYKWHHADQTDRFLVLSHSV